MFIFKKRFFIRDEQSSSNNFKKTIMADNQTYIQLAKLSLTPNKIHTLSSEYTLQPNQFYKRFFQTNILLYKGLG